MGVLLLWFKSFLSGGGFSFFWLWFKSFYDA